MLKWFADRLAQTGRDARKDERGFTLIELLVVVIIIGILAAIAIPTFLGQRENAQDASAETDLRNGATAMESFFTEDDTYSGADVEALEEIEPSIEWDDTSGYSEGVVAVSSNDDDGYLLETESESGNQFELERDISDGASPGDEEITQTN